MEKIILEVKASRLLNLVRTSSKLSIISRPRQNSGFGLLVKFWRGFFYYLSVLSYDLTF